MSTLSSLSFVLSMVTNQKNNKLQGLRKRKNEFQGLRRDELQMDSSDELLTKGQKEKICEGLRRDELQMAKKKKLAGPPA